MKKIISLLLVLVLAFSFVSCLNEGTSDDDNETTKKKTEDVVISRGTIVGTKYKNDCMGLEFTRPSSWVYATDEEIALAIGVGAEMLGSDKFQDALNNSTAIYDMMVIDKLTNANIIVGYENLKRSLSSNITEEQYIEMVKKQFSGVTSITVTFPSGTSKVKLGETTFTRVVCKTTANGVTITQVYYVHKIGHYMGMIIVSIPSGFTVEEIEAMFS